MTPSLPIEMLELYQTVQQYGLPSYSKSFKLVPLWLYFLGFETPLRDPRGLYKGYMKAILGKPFRVTTLGIQPWNR